MTYQPPKTAFDAKPFIQSFESAVDRLIAIRKDVQDKTERMEKSVRVAEREYSKKMAELNRGFDVCALYQAECSSSHIPRRPSGRHFPAWRAA